MDELTFDDACLCFALRRESRGFLGEFRPQQSFPGSPCPARFCGPSWLTVLVLETGIGRPHTEAAIHWLLGRPQLGNVPYRPKLVLSAGFCGALDERLHTGDVVLASEVADEEGNVFPTTWPEELPPGEWRPPLHRGRVLTATRLVGDGREKQTLGERHGALAVDMESAAVAGLCARQQVPFGCVRVVSDDLHTPLSPRLISLLAGSRVSSWQVLKTLCRSPGSAGEFWRLAKQTRHAADQLGKALGELLTLTLPWSDEDR